MFAIVRKKTLAFNLNQWCTIHICSWLNFPTLQRTAFQCSSVHTKYHLFLSKRDQQNIGKYLSLSRMSLIAGMLTNVVPEWGWIGINVFAPPYALAVIPSSPVVSTHTRMHTNTLASLSHIKPLVCDSGTTTPINVFIYPFQNTVRKKDWAFTHSHANKLKRQRWREKIGTRSIHQHLLSLLIRH